MFHKYKTATTDQVVPCPMS